MGQAAAAGASSQQQSHLLDLLDVNVGGATASGWVDPWGTPAHPSEPPAPVMPPRPKVCIHIDKTLSDLFLSLFLLFLLLKTKKKRNFNSIHSSILVNTSIRTHLFCPGHVLLTILWCLISGLLSRYPLRKAFVSSFIPFVCVFFKPTRISLYSNLL